MNKTIIPTDWKILPHTVGLVYLAELNSKIVEKIYNELDHEKKDHYAYYFLIFTANNAFFESIGILHTLLCSTKKEELRLEPLLIETLKKKDVETMKHSLKQFHDIRTKFKNYTFDKVRHTAGAHKNKNLPYPAGSTNLLIQKKFIENLQEIISELKINTSSWFNYSLSNPHYQIMENLDNIFFNKNH